MNMAVYFIFFSFSWVGGSFGGTRTHKAGWPSDFESDVYTVPPRSHILNIAYPLVVVKPFVGNYTRATSSSRKNL